jgi:NAD-dependent DNA ligase
MTILEDFLSDPYTFIEDAKLSQIIKLINDSNKQYYNFDNPIMSDEEYDILKDELQNRNPNHKLLKQIGDDTHSKDKIKLPYFMGSMDKIKPNTGVVDKWILKYKGPYVISDKLDGSSGLLVIKNKQVKLFTRGNGTIGTDISSITKKINGIPQNDLNIVVRGELIIKKSKFSNFKDTYSNLRAMINGLVGKKNISDQELKLIDFVSYEIIEPEVKPSEQMKLLKKLNFITVENKSVKSINENFLSSYFKERKEKSKYDIDGIIITNNNEYDRNTSGNPKYSFAFKELIEDQIVETEIIDVEWRISKDGLIKPRVHVKPVKISGVTIMHVTGHNAKNIVDNGIGKGAKIKLTRAGEVIPFILKVIKKVLPSKPKVAFKWNATKVDYILDESKITSENEYDILVKNILYFFKKMNIKNVDESIIKKMIDINLNSINKIINATVEDFLNIENFKNKMATKVYENIQNAIIDVKLSQLMTATNLFGSGLGSKKLQLIINKIPDILNLKINKSNLADEIKKIDGFDTKTATQFAEKLPAFKKFLKENKNITILVEENKKLNNNLQDKKFVFTGFRNKMLEEIIVKSGGEITNTISKNTTYLVTNNKEAKSSKLAKATDLNIKILNVDELLKILKIKPEVLEI